MASHRRLSLIEESCYAGWLLWESDEYETKYEPVSSLSFQKLFNRASIEDTPGKSRTG